MKKKLLLVISLIVLLQGAFAQKLERYRKLNDTVVHSAFLNNDKAISIYVPLEWQADLDKTYPLTIVFDRQNQRTHHFIINTIDFLTATDQVPSSVIISINSDRNKRFRETNYRATDANGLAEKNISFLFDELIPFAQEKLKTNSFRLFIGHSRYGFFASGLFANHIDDLSAVIAIEPFFTQQNINLLEDFESLSNKVLTGQKYFRYAIGRDSYSQFTPAQEVLSTINHPKINIKGQLFEELEHYAIPAVTVPNALYEIFEFWAAQQNELLHKSADIHKIEDFQQEILAHYGENLTFSLSALYGMGFTYYNQGEYEKSIEAWQKFLTIYPNFSEAYLNILRAQKHLNLDTEETIVAFKRSLEKSDFYSDEQKKEMIESLP
ncbi:tetratricopeptide repeat protein [Nonlabens xiamenensis]|uniref:tetratricopeptide repeat protein n=1 Tax=Nonlabens xiamenensis TaxID=2341043 RepID=UPI000F610D0B|nr:tetratricopeptide repeat protein [Nonlabens xiamenensis]